METIVLNSKKAIFSVIMSMGNIDKLICSAYTNNIAVYHNAKKSVMIFDKRINCEIEYNDYENGVFINFQWNNAEKLVAYYYEKSNSLENELNNYKISLKHETENSDYWYEEYQKYYELNESNKKYYNSIIEKMNNNIGENDIRYNNIIDSLHDEIDEKNRIIESLNEEIDEKNSIIELLENESCVLGDEIDEKNEIIRQLENDIQYYIQINDDITKHNNYLHKKIRQIKKA